MAAYAALVSVMHIIDNLRHHSRPPISLHDEQAYPLTKKNKLIASLKNLLSSKPISLHKEQVHHLTEKITFLQEFLEVYNPNLDYSKEADPLESRIALAAYAAEDTIESHILDKFTNSGEKMSSYSLYKALKKVIEDMALIEKETMEIKETVGFQSQLHAKSMAPADSSISSSSPITQKSISMVGADGVLLEMKEKLASGRLELQTIPIVGMGGSGKTTLALNIYHDRLIEEHFDIRAWVTISQEYNIQEILIQLLTQLLNKPNKGLSESELGEMLYKHLFGRRFMITLDDMWSIKAWDGVRSFFPDNNNGSRAVVTTRLTTLASALPNSNSLGMKLLDEDDSWELLSKIVFGEKGCCPSGFEKIGKKIGKSCKGLPLSIILVGGLLAKSRQTKEFWEHMEKNLNAIVNLEDDERCLKTLYMSYKQLPVHLKPCFLYMGIYREDHKIRIPDLIKLWVAEGFLKLVKGERPEDVARLYLKDLIDRNLIFIHELGSIGSIKYCKVHDLLRDLCLREAQKEGFYTVYPGEEIGNRVDRIVISGTMPEIKTGPLSSVPRARSLILDLQINRDPRIHILRLMRIVGTYISTYDFIGNVPQLVNSRFFTSNFVNTNFPSLMWLFWNLQILKVFQFDFKFTAPTDIWYMTNLRHLYFQNLHLLDYPNVPDGIVLTNLQTLGEVNDFTCSEEVVKRIPNIRKLHITYYEGVDERFCLANLVSLEKLESLFFYLQGSMMCRINYPQSLKKLSLVVERSQSWQDILDKIGALPLLEKLKLNYGTFKGQWETTDDQFRSLKFLSLTSCEGLQVWTSEASHFPRLEQLCLSRLDDLEEIPLDFADITTLRVIDVAFCRDSAIEAAKRILEEQEALYGEEETTLQIQVMSLDNDPALKSFKSPNFHVKFLR